MLNTLNIKIAGKVITACLLALSTASVLADSHNSNLNAGQGKAYLGIFGGGGVLTNTKFNQYGTVYFIEAQGGPLAVDAFGKDNRTSVAVVGSNIGFAWSNYSTKFMRLSPAAELEAFYMGGAKIRGSAFNNTNRLGERNFENKLPLRTGVFLANVVLNVSSLQSCYLKPYLGIGFGSALVSMYGARSFQTNPAEPGVNHFNVRTGDKVVPTFAMQTKLGTSYQISANTSLFAEYRYLFLAETNHTLGSTNVPGHATTSPWTMKIRQQSYHMGMLGIRFDL